MRLRPFLPLLVLAGLGCHAPSEGPATPALFNHDTIGDLATQMSVGAFAVHIDLPTLTGTATPIVRRSGAQSESYNLAINNFLSWDTFRVTGVALSDDSLQLTYLIKHPFASATNLAGPATAKNREDLAITGRVLWLADDPDAETYFAGDGDVRVNTRIVQNPDGYFTPGGLIPAPGTTSNTFPYQLIVDEAKNNRIGLSNNTVAQGNYGAAGWQVAEFTTGATGYDVLAQGQSAINVLDIARSELGGGNVFDVIAAIVAKYEDPRGGANGIEKRANRLPTNDVLKFGFRMPHGALDVGHLAVSAPSAMDELTSGNIDLAVHVRDWDARASEAAQTNLSTETNPTLVSKGESGLPTVDFDIPAIAGLTGTALSITDDDSAVGGDAEADSGAAIDELFFIGTAAGTPPAGSQVTGLVRAVDIVDITPPADWLINRIDLTPDLLPLGTGHEGATYQSFTIELLPSNAGAFRWADTWGGSSTDFATDVAVDALGNSYVTGSYDGTADFDPGVAVENRDSNGALDAYVVSFDPAGDFRWVSILGGDSTQTPTRLALDQAMNLYITGSYYGTLDFDPGAGVIEETSNGDRDIFVVSLDSDGNYRWHATAGSTGSDEGLGIVADPLGNNYTTGNFFETVDFNPGPGAANRTSAGLRDPFVLALTSTGTYRWVNQYGGTRFDAGLAIDQDASGHLYVGGSYEDAADLQPGPGITNYTAAGSYDSYLLSLTANGGYRWSSAWGGGPSDEVYGVTVSGGGFSYVCGYYGGLCDFDPSSLSVNRTAVGFTDGYVMALNPLGHYRWVATFGGPSHDIPSDIDLDDHGRLYLAGFYQGTTDLDPGPGVRAHTSQGFDDIFILSLGSYGAYRWSAVVGSTVDSDLATGIAVTGSGRSYTAGYFWDMADFDPGPASEIRTAVGLKDSFLLALEP